MKLTMPDTIDLKIPSAIEAAAKRAILAIDSHYLPAQLNADLRTLVEAAMCWGMYGKQRPADCPSPARRWDDKLKMYVHPD